MRAYSSNEELFQHIRDLAAQLQEQGQATAAQALKDGLSSINGLTDGWALLMESIVQAIQLSGNSLQKELLSQFNELLVAVRKVVFR
ncbi:hypothetical protein [Dechloromonas sp. CZR5]|uniref:hypothetical protein n=1 Tax=Dechloromonas sp. CZR5 TaxID=2608630 RepID=UPI00123D9F4D|nr:hypothetical protein [Dechloromonas sp. CZR5]